MNKIAGSPSRVPRYLVQALTGLTVAPVAFVAVLMTAILLSGFFGFDPVIVLSGSMEPAIRAGDIAVTRDVDPKNMGVGDIVTYRSGSNLVTHRIVNVVHGPQGRELEVKGDNNPTPDATLVPEERVVAELTFAVPKLGYLVSFAQSPMGLALFVIAPGAALALLWGRGRREKGAHPRRPLMPHSDQNLSGE